MTVGLVESLRPVRFSPLLPAVVRVGGPSLSSFRGFGTLMIVCSFMSRQDALLLGESLDAGDVFSGLAC